MKRLHQVRILKHRNIASTAAGAWKQVDASNWSFQIRPNLCSSRWCEECRYLLQQADALIVVTYNQLSNSIFIAISCIGSFKKVKKWRCCIISGAFRASNLSLSQCFRSGNEEHDTNIRSTINPAASMVIIWSTVAVLCWRNNLGKWRTHGNSWAVPLTPEGRNTAKNEHEIQAIP